MGYAVFVGFGWQIFIFFTVSGNTKTLPVAPFRERRSEHYPVP